MYRCCSEAPPPLHSFPFRVPRASIFLCHRKRRTLLIAIHRIFRSTPRPAKRKFRGLLPLNSCATLFSCFESLPGFYPSGSFLSGIDPGRWISRQTARCGSEVTRILADSSNSKRMRLRAVSLISNVQYCIWLYVTRTESVGDGQLRVKP